MYDALKILTCFFNKFRILPQPQARAIPMSYSLFCVTLHTASSILQIFFNIIMKVAAGWLDYFLSMKSNCPLPERKYYR